MAGRHVPGATPMGDFVDSADPFGMKLGLITRVDEINMKADVKVLTGGGYRFEIDLTQGMSGPRSFWGGVPEVGSMVILGYRRKHKRVYDAMILGYIPVGNRAGLRFDPMAPVDPASVAPEDQAVVNEIFGPTVRYKRLKMRPGDVGGMSSSGSEFVMNRDVRISNRAGDTVEIRDADRTLITQALHRVDSAAGVHSLSGPIRRADFNTPPDILQADGRTLIAPVAPNDWQAAQRYFGRPVYQSLGTADAPLADANGKLLNLFNNQSGEFPPTTFSNGKRTFYPSTKPFTAFETEAGAGGYPYVEHRLELAHTTDMTQEVLGEIDGFAVDRQEPYIEQVLGTIVGNGTFSTMSMRQYANILMPVIFDDWVQPQPGSSFHLDAINRVGVDNEVNTLAGAYLFRIRSPQRTDQNYFTASISKQGKLFLNVPGSQQERYPSGSKNVSVEANLSGALKAFIGAQTPNNVSMNITCAGGIHLNLGADDQGNSLYIEHHGALKTRHMSIVNDGGASGTDTAAVSEEVEGNKEIAVQGAFNTTVEGTMQTVVNGQYQVQVDRMTTQAHSGHTLNAGEENVLISGKSQYNYAMVVLENIVAGGKISTIMAGGKITTVAAGAIATTALGGAVSTTVAAGAYTVSVGTGAVSMTTAAGVMTLSTAAGVISIAAGAGAIAITAGLAINLTAPAAISLLSPQVLLGGPPAVLGVCRGLPIMPPGGPSLDWITGLPLMGCAVIRSI